VVPYGPIRAPAGTFAGPVAAQLSQSAPRSELQMATARPTLTAEHREVTGKAVNRMRKEGRLPAVVFGHGLESASVSLNTHDFEQLRRRVGQNALIDLSVDGSKTTPVLVQHVQVHPVNRRPLHVDLFAVRMTEELTVDVPLIPTGESAAVTQLGGTLLHPTEQLRVKALPDHLPQSISYSIESLVDFDSAVKVSDLEIPGDVTLLTDPDEVIATVQRPRIEVEEVPEVEEVAEGEEGAEGEAAATAEGEAPATAEGGEGSGES
jgi:large subunit ribosomal protein L25